MLPNSSEYDCDPSCPQPAVAITRTQILKNFGSEASDLITYVGKCADLDLDDPANRNRIMGSLATVRMHTALAKVDPAIELVHDILLLQKVVVFAHHRKVILALM